MMNRKLSRFMTTVTGIGVAMLMSTAAWATPPATVVGTWTLLVDQTSTTLEITNQGGPGNGVCRVILGTIGVAPVRGYYCPPTGHFHFLHNNIASGATARTFTGSVTDAIGGNPAHMAGTFNVMNVAFGPFGEYPFSGVR
jgi:hypothetical protein